MVKSSAATPICFTSGATRPGATPSRARFWSSATPPVRMPIRCSAARARSASASPAYSPTRRPSWTARRWWARPARYSRRPCASSPTPTSTTPAALFSRLLQWRDARKDHLNPGAATRLGVEVEPTAQPVGHDTVDDVQAEPGAALIAARGEERVEGAAPDVEAHAAAIVGKQDLDVILAELARLDMDRAWPAARKGVRDRIEEQVGEDLSIGPGIGVHHEIGL